MEPTNTNTSSNIRPINVVDEMKKSYINYAMSVIVSRALPDVRDGLKPVQRRILFSMKEQGLTSGAGYRKCAKVVGDVLGRYHPHGDMSVYDAMVRMAQDFSMRYPLIDGQGNFGSIDGDGAAAMRYTESRLEKLAMELIDEINQNTVNFGPNYDGKEVEPQVLPANIPNVILNGAEGIAVGMATKIPPHNLTEVLGATRMILEKGVVKYEKNIDTKYAEHIKTQKDLEKLSTDRFPYFESSVTVDDLYTHIKGPDFPTAGVIYNSVEVKNMLATGKGRILMRGVAKIDENKSGKMQIIITELPYQVNKARLVARIAALVNDRKLEGISDIRDESNKEGIRVLVELKKDSKPKVVLNNLFKYTELQKSFSANVLCLVDGEPRVLSMREILEQFIKHRQEITIRKSEYELAKNQERIHILEGLKIALDNLDEVIRIIRQSESAEVAKETLMKKFKLSEIQATAILDMQLRKLAQLERNKIEEEYKALKSRIDALLSLLSTPQKIIDIIDGDLEVIMNKYGDKRKTKVIKGDVDQLSEDDLIAKEEVIITLSEKGYIKRMKRDIYQVQNRGGKGKIGMEIREEDAVAHILSCSTHDYIMFFTNKGRVFETKVYDIAESSRTAKGQAVVNIINLEAGEIVTAMLTHQADGTFSDNVDVPLEGEEPKEVAVKRVYKYLFFATRSGTVKKTSLEEYGNIRQNGLIAINLSAGDELSWVKPTTGTDTIMLITKLAKSIHFSEEDVRPTGRSSMGVVGIRFKFGDDHVIAMDVVKDTKHKLLTVTELGFGKVTILEEFATQTRGGSGVFAHSISKKTGDLVSAKIMSDNSLGLMLMSEQGQTIKIAGEEIPNRNRQTTGVHLIRLNDGDKVGAIALV